MASLTTISASTATLKGDDKLENISGQEQSEVLLPPIKPSYINYCVDHFDYEGPVHDFVVVMNEVSKEVPFYLRYDEKKYKFEILAYPNDEKILYAIQLYYEPDRNCNVIEFHRLDGLGFTYRNHVMEVWTALNARGIGSGVPSTAKSPMPSSLSVDDDDYEMDKKVLIPMLERLEDEYVNAQILGLKMLLSTVKIGLPTLKAVEEADVLSKVIECGLKSNHMEVDRLVGAVLRELYGCCYDLKMGNCAYELAMLKIKDYQQKDDLAALEAQRNFVMVLNKMLHFFFETWKYGDKHAKINALFDMNVGESDYAVDKLSLVEKEIYDLLLFMHSGHREYFKAFKDFDRRNRNEATRTRDCELQLPKIDRPGKSITMVHLPKKKKSKKKKSKRNRKK